MDLWGDEHHTPLCEAVWDGRLPLLHFYLQRYQARGAAELERALTHPCRKDGREFSLLGHALRGCEPDSVGHVNAARYLVQ